MRMIQNRSFLEAFRRLFGFVHILGHGIIKSVFFLN